MKCGPSRRRRAAALAALAVLGCPAKRDTGPQLYETSGVARVENQLILVGDDDPGGYYAFELPSVIRGSTIALPHDRLTRIPIPPDAQSTDLESVARLADGRLVVLSEDGALLTSLDGVVARYDSTCREVSNRGLEGIAVRPESDGSVVAVVWEGGYPIAQPFGGPPRAQRPFVVVHHLPPGAMDMEVPATSVRIPLQVPVPPGSEPQAQRFRAPDLVWHRQADGVFGFIVLLSSENAAGRKRYEHRWLQRFDPEGRPVGEPLDLDALVPEERMRGRNWEGLDWFEEGKRLVVVHENYPEDATFHALLVDLPEDWRAGAEGGSQGSPVGAEPR